MSSNFKRKKKLINSRLQLRLIATFLTLGCMASLFQVVMLNHSILRLARRMPEGSEHLMEAMPGILGMNLLMTMVLLVPLMAAVGVVVTHRVAGPCYRFSIYLKALAAGEYTGPCRVRDGDELRDLCDELNQAIDKLRSGEVKDLTDAENQEAAEAESEATPAEAA